jgi:hypothetical protein
MDQPGLRSFDTAMGLGGAGPVISEGQLSVAMQVTVVSSWSQPRSSILRTDWRAACKPPRYVFSTV